MNFQSINSHIKEEFSECSSVKASHTSHKAGKAITINQDVLLEILEENKQLKAKVANLEKALSLMKEKDIFNTKNLSFDIDKRKLKKLQKFRDQINDENMNNSYVKIERESESITKLLKKVAPKILNMNTSMNTDRVALHTAKNSIKHCKNHLNNINKEKQKFKKQLYKLKKLSRSQERMIRSIRKKSSFY
ncbi:unnamed protein product [Moneuplotes crassus]|uniref:Uncharacterized protein n=1 Tax=Euplotes crassus TaxID=5936 RepID=A0AAD1XW95_EUPCR|nr:unnamed protein product [Moneuplotes crassus]